MITRCPYCSYKYDDEPLSLDIMRQAHAKDLPVEDYLLWMKRLMDTAYKEYGLRSYRGIKVHIGRKHKGEFNYPKFEFNKTEHNIIYDIKEA